MHTHTATASQKPAYLCDICEQEITDGERYATDTSGLTVEHVDCARDWFRRNYGRESLS